MIVTYLIGNGFDLGIGLKTGFKDFLKFYLTVESENEDIIDFKETIKQESIDLWADLELKFGEYINTFEDNELPCYIKIYEDILANLNVYLKNENCKIDTGIKKILEDNKEKFLNDILLFNWEHIGLRLADYKNIERTNYYRDETIVMYNFITFNYTTTFDQILYNILDWNDDVLFTNKKGVNTRRINGLFHIHGQLNDNMIFGVNDKSQLPFSGQIPNNVIRRVVKPRKNNALGNTVDETGKELIQNSDIICIYGMSIGETDSIWWERIGNWLTKSNSHWLIYFVHDTNINADNPVYGIDYMLDAEEEYRNKFIDAAGIADNFNVDIDSVRQRIIVIINSNFMQMKLVKDEKEDKNEAKDGVTV